MDSPLWTVASKSIDLYYKDKGQIHITLQCHILSQMFNQTYNLNGSKMEDCEEKDMAEDDATDSSSYKSAPSHLSPETQRSITSGKETGRCTFEAEKYVITL